MRDLVSFLARSVLPDCDAIEVTQTDRDGQYVVDIIVPEADVGRLIGRHGRIIQSIRSVAKAVAKKRGVHVSVEVIGRPLSANSPQ